MVAGFPEQAGISYLVGVAILGLAVAVYAALASRAEQYRIRRIREITNEVETWHGKIQNYKAELAKFTSEQDEERKEFRHKFEEKFGMTSLLPQGTPLRIRYYTEDPTPRVIKFEIIYRL